MIVNDPEPIKARHQRASGPKVRTGCITCKARHLKCDEDKPFCRRCRDDKFPCDGYAMPKPKASKQRKRRQPRGQASQPPAQSATMTATVNELSLFTDFEKLYFHHFLQHTTKQLSVSPASTNFWLRYAFPMSCHSESIRYSMTAVGAAHRLFMARSVGFSNPWELKRLAIHQYNKAIASILPTMSAKSDIHDILICCLLFISFEGLTGRYGELFKHLQSGNRLFYSLLPASTAEGRVVGEKLTEMFCRIGVESSSFMDEHCLSGVSQWYSHNSSQDATTHPQFNNLDEASYELRRLDLRHSNKPWDVGADHVSEADQDTEEEAPGLALQEGLRDWSQRFESFEASCQLKDHSDESISQLQNLRLRRLFWQMTIDAFASEDARSNTQLFVPFMAVAESVAAPFIATGQPTFSLDGDLISGLSFVVSVTADNGIRLRALNLLRQLNRREGIWDSNDVVEMHELSVSFNESGGAVMETHSERETEIHAGLPGIIQELRRKVSKS